MGHCGYGEDLLLSVCVGSCRCIAEEGDIVKEGFAVAVEVAVDAAVEAVIVGWGCLGVGHCGCGCGGTLFYWCVGGAFCVDGVAAV